MLANRQHGILLFLCRALPIVFLGVAYVGLAWAENSSKPAKADEIRDFSGSFVGEPHCYSCLEENYAQFQKLLAKFKAAARPTKLEKIDDFYLSRVGVLIHEECFDTFGSRLDVEQAVTDAIVTGFTCMIKGKEFADRQVGRDDMNYANGGSVYQKHVPRLVNLFTRHHRVSFAPIHSQTTAGGMVDLRWSDPCQSHATDLGHGDLRDGKPCRFVPEVELGRPKVYCRADNFTRIGLAQQGGEGRAASSLPFSVNPSFLPWQDKVKVYNPPMVTFLPKSHGMDAGAFQSTLWHELFHNLGYEHDSNTAQDDPYFCQVACFWDQHASRTLRKSLRSYSAQTCTTIEKMSDSNRDTTNAIATDIGNSLNANLERDDP